MRWMKPTTDVSGMYPSSGGFAHSMMLDKASRWLFTSGTMGLDERWQAPETIEEQLELVWQNINRLLKENNFSVDDIVHLTCLLTDPLHAKHNAAAIKVALNGREIPRTVFCTQLLDPTWLAEIQVIAAQRGGH